MLDLVAGRERRRIWREQCAELLVRSRKTLNPIERLPSLRASCLNCNDSDLKQSYLIQGLVAKREMALAGSRVVGYKVANTNATSQGYLNVPHPFYGPILSSRCIWVDHGLRAASVDCRQHNLRLVEPEIGLVLSQDLKPGSDRLSASRIEGAIGQVIPSLEIVHTSFSDWQSVGAESLIADLASNGFFLFGKGLDKKKFPSQALGDYLANVKCEMFLNGEPIAWGIGSKALGGPLKVVEFLANDVIRRSKGKNWLKKDQVISTGVIVDPPYYFAAPGDEIQVIYGETSTKWQIKVQFS